MLMSLLSFQCLLNRRYIIVDCKIVLVKSPFYSLLLNLSERNKSLFTLSPVRHNHLLVRMSPRVLKNFQQNRQKMPNIIFGFFSSTEYQKRHFSRLNSRVCRIWFPALCHTHLTRLPTTPSSHYHQSYDLCMWWMWQVGVSGGSAD